MLDIARNTRHVGEEGGTRENDWIVPDEGGKAEKEGVEIEIEPMADFPSLLQDFEGKPSDEPRSVDRDSNVCQGEKEQHDVVWNNIMRSNSAIMYLLPANGQNGEQEQVSNQRCGEKVHRNSEEHKCAPFAFSYPSGMARWVNNAQCTRNIENRSPQHAGDIDRDVIREKNVDVCRNAQDQCPY